MLILTSNPGGISQSRHGWVATKLNSDNQFTKTLKKLWPARGQVLIISSDPEDTAFNDLLVPLQKQAFELSGLDVSEVKMCDQRNASDIDSLIKESQIILLAGGHVPTQNAFFKRLNLKELLREYQGIIIGISAGSMNSADIVYAQPELEGESIDPAYDKYPTGLGLTRVNILPHYMMLKQLSLDGKKVIGDIAIADSYLRSFYAIEDGTYIIDDGQTCTCYGTAYLFDQGRVSEVCKKGESANLHEVGLD